MQEYCDVAPTPRPPFWERATAVPQLTAAGEGVTAQAAGKPLLPPHGFPVPSRTATVKEQRYLDALSLLSTQNEREPAEQKHSYFPLAALCSFYSQNSS